MSLQSFDCPVFAVPPATDVTHRPGVRLKVEDGLRMPRGLAVRDGLRHTRDGELAELLLALEEGRHLLNVGQAEGGLIKPPTEVHDVVVVGDAKLALVHRRLADRLQKRVPPANEKLLGTRVAVVQLVERVRRAVGAEDHVEAPRILAHRPPHLFVHGVACQRDVAAAPSLFLLLLAILLGLKEGLLPGLLLQLWFLLVLDDLGFDEPFGDELVAVDLGELLVGENPDSGNVVNPQSFHIAALDAVVRAGPSPFCGARGEALYVEPCSVLPLAREGKVGEHRVDDGVLGVQCERV